MTFHKLALAALLFIGVTACKTTEPDQRELKDYVSSYLNDNDEAVAFGNAKLKTILNKADYKNTAMLGAILGGQMETFEPLIDLDGAVYYVAHGPMKKDGSPDAMTLFVKVKDMEGLKKHLKSEMSYDIEDAKDFSYTQDGDMSLGLRGNLAVILVKSGDYDAKEALAAAFTKSDAAPSGGNVEEILNTEGDIVLGADIANLLGTSDGEINDLPEDKRKELLAMVENSYSTTSLKFEEGAAVIDFKNMFSAELNKRMFLNADNGAPIRKKLGHGTPRAGLSINIDIDKMESFLKDFSPEAAEELTGGDLSAVKMMGGAKTLGDIISGQAGFLMFGSPQEGSGLEPQFNAFVGLEPKGKALGDMAKMLLSNGDADVHVNGEGIALSSNQKYAGPGTLSLPTGAENFGKSGVSFFINLEGFSEEEIADMFDGSDEFSTVMRVAKFISFEYGNEGGKLRIEAKDGKENILKQAMQVLMDDFASQMGDVSI